MKKGKMVKIWAVVWAMTLLCGMLTACKDEQPEAIEEWNWEDDSEETVAYEEEKTKEEETTEEKQETWVPENFERYTIEEPLFVAPAVHTEANEQCTFLWTVTEDDMIQWFKDKSAGYEGYKSIHVYNTTGTDCFDIRKYTATRTDDEKGASVSIDIETSGYNEKYVSDLRVELSSQDLQGIVADLSEVIEMMNLGEYTEEILHCDSGLSIETENGLGYYSLYTNYSTSEYEQDYTLALSISYIDNSYAAYVFDYTPEKMEYWQDEYAFSDYVVNSEFDTSSFEAFQTDILHFIQSNFDATYTNTGEYRQKFNYAQEEFDAPKKDIVIEYNIESNGESMYEGGTSFSYDEDEESMGLYIGCNFVYNYDYAISGRDISEAEIQRLCETRYELLKKIDTTTECTLDDMIKIYRKEEFGEEFDKHNFESSDHSYHIGNNFQNLSYSCFDYD